MTYLEGLIRGSLRAKVVEALNRIRRDLDPQDSESDVREKFINEILRKVFGWPPSRIKREKKRSDVACLDEWGNVVVVVECKRIGIDPDLQHVKQLKGYCDKWPLVKIGALTNGEDLFPLTMEDLDDVIARSKCLSDFSCRNPKDETMIENRLELLKAEKYDIPFHDIKEVAKLFRENYWRLSV